MSNEKYRKYNGKHKTVLRLEYASDINQQPCLQDYDLFNIINCCFKTAISSNFISRAYFKYKLRKEIDSLIIQHGTSMTQRGVNRINVAIMKGKCYGYICSSLKELLTQSANIEIEAMQEFIDDYKYETGNRFEYRMMSCTNRFITIISK